MKTIRMKKADWEKWDTALRSGEYKQGTGMLCSNRGDSYCCLGVLQHVLDGDVERYTDSRLSFPLPTKEWLDSHNIDFRDGGGAPCKLSPYLTSLHAGATVANDMGADFITLADAIKDAVEFTD